MIHYQGKLTDPAGNPLTGARTLQFQLFDSPTAGNSIFGPEIHNNVQVTNGVFDVNIGSILSTLPAAVRGHADIWLEVRVDGTRLDPRQKLGASPYSLAVADDSIGSAEIIDGSIGNADINTNAAIAASKLSGVLTAGGNRTDTNLDALTGGGSITLHTHAGLTPGPHTHSASDINADTLPVARGGTGIDTYTAGSYINALNASTLQQRTPTQVLGDIGAASASHNHDASAINAGTLPAARGGTGIGTYTAGNYLNALDPSTLQQRTPAQVLGDIGAAPTSHNHNASAINAGTLGVNRGGTGQDWSVIGKGAVPYFTDTGILGALGVGTDGTVLKLSGGVPVWGTDLTGGGGSVTGSGTANKIGKWTGPSAMGDSQITEDSGGNVGIGVSNPGAKLEVSGQVKITGGSPGNGKVLTSDAAGLATWQTPAAGGGGAFSGQISITAAASPPPGWLLCDGSQVSRTAFAALFAAIGTTYGPGDGSTTFNLPDARGRVVLGGGAGPGLTARTLGQKSGEEAHTLSLNEMPNHQHSYELHNGSGPNIKGDTVIRGAIERLTSGVDGHSQSIGSALPHNNMPPFIVFNVIIKI